MIMQDIMDVADIAFPHLGIYLRNVPRSFSIFGFSIAFYGVIIGLGIFCGILLAAHIAKKEQLNPDLIWDFAIYAIIFSIIGARIYYVIFRWDLYQDDLLSIFNTRKGGLAIYGAVIAAFITLWVYCRVKKQKFLQIADICVPALVLGQIIGRWGNFMNREAFGGETTVPWRMRLWTSATEYIEVHPTFFYESLWNLIGLLLIVLLIARARTFDGENTCFYFIWYYLILF